MQTRLSVSASMGAGQIVHPAEDVALTDANFADTTAGARWFLRLYGGTCAGSASLNGAGAR